MRIGGTTGGSNLVTTSSIETANFSFDGALYPNVSTARWYPPVNTKLSSFFFSLGVAPASDVIVQLKVNGVVEGAPITCQAGNYKSNVGSYTKVVTTSDYISIDIVQGTSGSDLFGTLLYSVDGVAGGSASPAGTALTPVTLFLSDVQTLFRFNDAITVQGTQIPTSMKVWNTLTDELVVGNVNANNEPLYPADSPFNFDIALGEPEVFNYATLADIPFATNTWWVDFGWSYIPVIEDIDSWTTLLDLESGTGTSQLLLQTSSPTKYYKASAVNGVFTRWEILSVTPNSTSSSIHLAPANNIVVNMPNHGEVLSSTFSIELIFKIHSYYSYGLIFALDDDNNYYYKLGLDSSGSEMIFRVGDYTFPIGSFPLDKWMHLAIQRTPASEPEFDNYVTSINGDISYRSLPKTPRALNNSDSRLFIGESLNMTMNSMRISNVLISPDQVATAIANAANN